jgi:hypothetical protein
VDRKSLVCQETEGNDEAKEENNDDQFCLSELFIVIVELVLNAHPESVDGIVKLPPTLEPKKQQARKQCLWKRAQARQPVCWRARPQGFVKK